MKLYELNYTILPNLSEEEQQKLAERVISFLPTQSVKQQSSGFLNTLEFSAEPEKIKEIEEQLKKESQIQRHLIVKKVFPQKEVKAPRRLISRQKINKKPETFVPSSGRGKSKVELEEIEKKLDEILKE